MENRDLETPMTDHSIHFEPFVSSTPLNAPPNLSSLPLPPGDPYWDFPPFQADPGFVERAAGCSCSQNGNGLDSQIGSEESEFPEVEITGNANGIAASSTEYAAEESAVGGSRCKDENLRKRHSPGEDDSKWKKRKPNESNGNGKVKSMEPNGNEKQNKDNNRPLLPPEPPKDYIHVRARRGQATDSHSLAERARREKISERIKFLQNLVPGCNEVTGKAVVLSQIINYVQSLQHRVELLSMKLATVNPTMELLSMETQLSKINLQSCGSSAQSIYPYQSLLKYQRGPSLSNSISSGKHTHFSTDSLNTGLGESAFQDDLQCFAQTRFGQDEPQTLTRFRDCSLDKR